MLAELEAKEKEKGSKQGEVTPEMIAEVVARNTGVPVTNLLQSEKQKLLKLEKLLSKSVIGQPEAVKAVADAIRLNRTGLGNLERPQGSFLMVGPSGTGKTLLAKTVAKVMFNNEQALVRIDCAELGEKHTISRLIGSPPGYIGSEAGGQLTEAIRRRPYSLVLIDEIEKACREIVMFFLGILDDGYCTDAKGRKIDFRNTIIMMTSNLGASYLNEDTTEGPLSSQVREKVNGAIQAHFAPEVSIQHLGFLFPSLRVPSPAITNKCPLPRQFLNRIDATIIYRRLTQADLRGIVKLRISEIQDRLKRNGRKITLVTDEPAQDYLAATGYSREYMGNQYLLGHEKTSSAWDGKSLTFAFLSLSSLIFHIHTAIYGARPLARSIQQELLNPLSRLILQNRIRDGEKAQVTLDAQRNRLVIIPNHDADVEMDDEDDSEDEEEEDDGMEVEEVD